MNNKILIVGTDRKYFYTRKDTSKRILIADFEKGYILATDVVPYGLDFKFGNDERRFTLGRFHNEAIGLEEKEVTQRNLDLTIKGLETMVEEAKADFVLIDDLRLSHVTPYGRGQLLIRR